MNIKPLSEAPDEYLFRTEPNEISGRCWCLTRSDFAEIYPEEETEPGHVFFTEWCLTSGILKCEVAQGAKNEEGRITVKIGYHSVYAHAGGWARTFEEAQLQAEEMLFDAKQRAIKELQDLEDIRFDTFKEAK